MKKTKTIERKIAQYNKLIKKFRCAKTLEIRKKKQAIFILQKLIRALKWVLK